MARGPRRFGPPDGCAPCTRTLIPPSPTQTKRRRAVVTAARARGSKTWKAMSPPRRSSKGAWLRGGSGVGATARNWDGASGGSVVGRAEDGAVRACVILAGPPCHSGIVGVDTHDPPCREIIPRRTHGSHGHWHVCAKLAARPPVFPAIGRQHDRCARFAAGVLTHASPVLGPVIPVSLSGPPVQWSSPAARFAPLTAPDPAAAD
jgi:hypothetical protein